MAGAAARGPSAKEPVRQEACLRGMADLSTTSGLPLWLDAEHETVVLAQPGGTLRSEPQPLQLLRRVLLDPAAPAPDPPYWLFVEVALPSDQAVFSEHGIRHDLLVLRAGRLGPEYIKTWGHVQLCADGRQCPEAYGVLHGRAAFLLQQQAEAPEHPRGSAHVEDVRWLQAGPGQKAVVPATHGVVIANLGDQPLVLSRLAAADAWPTHQVYDRLQGAAYYLVERRGRMALVPNGRYQPPMPPPHEEPPLHAPELGVAQDMPLYSAFVHRPELMDWLRQGIPAVEGVG